MKNEPFLERERRLSPISSDKEINHPLPEFSVTPTNITKFLVKNAIKSSSNLKFMKLPNHFESNQIGSAAHKT